MALQVKQNPQHQDLTEIKVRRGFGNQNQFVDIRFKDPKIIGQGTFGVVFRTTLYDTGEDVAIKKVLQDRRFKNREVDMMQMLEHPNIVRLLYHATIIEEDMEFAYLVMELMPRTLFQVCRDYVKIRKPFPPFFIKLYMFQLLRALNFMHIDGIAHRDIKPQNLLVDPEYGVLKICDFGSAKYLDSDSPSITYICSRYYRAPELIFGRTNYTTSIDLWSAAIVLCEMFLGRAPFSGDTEDDVIDEIMLTLGRPREEDLGMVKEKYKFCKLKNYPPRNLLDIFKKSQNTMPPEGLLLLNNLLKYDERARMPAIECLAHRFFDEIRQHDLVLPNGLPAPALFDWYEKEASYRRELNRKIFPRTRPGRAGSDGFIDE